MTILTAFLYAIGALAGMFLISLWIYSVAWALSAYHWDRFKALKTAYAYGSATVLAIALLTLAFYLAG